MTKTTKATKRKRRKDKDDDALALQIAEIAEVSKYIREASGERIREKGELYLKQGAMIAGMEEISTGSGVNVPVSESDAKGKITPETAPILENKKIPKGKGQEDEKISTDVIPNPKSEIPVKQEEGEKISSGMKLIPEPAAEKTRSDDQDSEGISTNAISISEPAEPTKEEISIPLGVIPEEKTEGINIPLGVIPLTPTAILNPWLGDEKISIRTGVNPESQKILSTAPKLNHFFLSTTAGVNLQPTKVRFEQEHLIRFINGAHNILFCSNIDHRIKIVLLVILLKATCEKSVSTKVKTNDLLRILAMSKSIQKDISRVAEETGIAKVTVRRKGGTEVTFNEEIFNSDHMGGSKNGVIDRLIDIYNLSIYLEKNNEEKIEEKKSIPLQEIGKYISMLSLHLAGFPLKSVTESLIEAIKGKDPELIAAFWIYARNNSSKIKTPSAYLIKVINNNDTGNLSGEIMESAKSCVKAAQVIVRENYDEPELSFLRALAQKLSIPGRWDREDRRSLTAKLQMAGRELVRECEKVLGNLSKGEKS